MDDEIKKSFKNLYGYIDLPEAIKDLKKIEAEMYLLAKRVVEKTQSTPTDL